MKSICPFKLFNQVLFKDGQKKKKRKKKGRKTKSLEPGGGTAKGADAPFVRGEATLRTNTSTAFQESEEPWPLSSMCLVPSRKSKICAQTNKQDNY